MIEHHIEDENSKNDLEKIWKKHRYRSHGESLGPAFYSLRTTQWPRMATPLQSRQAASIQSVNIQISDFKLLQAVRVLEDCTWRRESQ